MSTDEEKKDETTTIATQPREASAASQAFEAIWSLAVALQDVAKAELAKGPGLASNAWRALHDAVAEIMGDAPMQQATPVVGRQPVTMPPGFKHPLPVKGGATPVRPDQPIMPSGPRPAGGGAPVSVVPPTHTGDIRARADVAAELERVKTKGKSK